MQRAECQREKEHVQCMQQEQSSLGSLASLVISLHLETALVNEGHRIRGHLQAAKILSSCAKISEIAIASYSPLTPGGHKRVTNFSALQA